MIQDYKINAFQKTHAMLPNDPSDTMTEAQLKAWWDSAPEEVRVALNGLIDAIGTDYATKAELSGIQLGQITDGTITPPKLSKAVTSAPTADTYVLRDGFGRAKFADPSANADAVTKGYLTAAIAIFARVESGQYTGDSTNNRTITLQFTPKLAVVVGRIQAGVQSRKAAFVNPYRMMTGDGIVEDVNIFTVTNGFRVGGVDASYNLNASTYVYDYVAMG